MTRINLVHVQDLADQHLFAEWREIKMVPAALRRSLRTRSIHDVSSSIGLTYTLNKGHVTFFYNKMLFLFQRYKQLTDELHARDFSIAEHDPDQLFLTDIVPEMQDPFWSPSNDEIEISVDRISLRLNERPEWYRYYGKVESPEFFIELYNQQLLVDTLAKSTV